MRKIFFLLVCNVFICSLVNAQVADSAFVAARFAFTHVMDSTQPENPLKENMILYLGKNMSMYTNYDRIERMAKLKASGQNIGTAADMNKIDMSNVKSMSVDGGLVSINTNSGGVSYFSPNPQMLLANSYFKDQEGAKLAYLSSAGGKLFSVEEQLPAIEWAITQETKDIKGLSCQKATGDFKGRTYEAWFCSQLPYNNGPWKLGGLPGLIIEASDTKKEVVFSFVSFENALETPVPVTLPAEAIKTTPKEFTQYQDAIRKDRAATAGSAGGGNIRVDNVRVTGTVSAGTVSAGAVKPRQMNNPIEKIK